MQEHESVTCWSVWCARVLLGEYHKYYCFLLQGALTFWVVSKSGVHVAALICALVRLGLLGEHRMVRVWLL